MGDKLVLVVDDVLSDRQGLETQLADLRIEAICASSGENAVDLAMMPEIRLVLMKLNLPEMSSFTAISCINASRPDLPIVALAASDSPETRAQCAQVGVLDFVTRPCGAEELRAVVSHAGFAV